MDLEYLKKNAKWYAYECRKFFPEDESPVSHYVCENEVLIISTKKIYIYYYRNMIDCVFDELQNIIISTISGEEKSLNITVLHKEFTLTFQEAKEMEYFLKYYHKYLIQEKG